VKVVPGIGKRELGTELPESAGTTVVEGLFCVRLRKKAV
jgi:hypothetical protein